VHLSNHSVIRDPPFSRLDLISCRNLLIYLKPGLQGQVFPLFHYALRPGGYLFLGLSENIARYTDLFLPLDKTSRIFRRRDLVARPPVPSRPFRRHAGRRGTVWDAGRNGGLKRSDLLQRIAGTIVEHFAPAFVVVDESGQALYFSAGTGKYLQAAAGPPNRDIVAMARLGLRPDLRALLPITGGGPRHLELTWTEQGGAEIGALPKRGFGTELIERGIRFELEGEAELGVVDGALHCRIVIPANPQYLTFGASSDRSPIEEAAS